MVNSLVDITLTTLWCDQNCCTSQRFYSCEKELIENLLNQWAHTFFVSSRAKDTGLKDHIHLTKNTPLILMTKKGYNHSWRFTAVILLLCVQVFQVCIQCIVVYVHVEQNLQKEKRTTWVRDPICFSLYSNSPKKIVILWSNNTEKLYTIPLTRSFLLI